jgi:ParB family transcriptional regulator, chromosome partitioning protein
LNRLCDEARAALALGTINLSQAEALTLGGDEAQRGILEEIERGSGFGGDDIKTTLLDDRPTVASAIFPVEEYTGAITTDLFAEDETSYFDDGEEFLRLQKEAVTQLVKHHEASAAWVELTEAYGIPDWHYREAEEGEEGGVLINLSPAGRVDIREGLVKRDIDSHTADETADSPIAPRKPKAAYSAVLCATIAHHKTAAVQKMLLVSPRKAKEVAVVDRLMHLRRHEAVTALAKETEPQSAYAVLEGQARLFARWLGFDSEAEESIWTQFPPDDVDDLTLYEAVRGLSDHELDQLETLLSALVFGQMVCLRLDTQDSLFNRVARDLSVDMRNHWRPDRSFFERRTRDQLVAIAVDCGYAEGAGRVASYKKADLVIVWSGISRTPAPPQRRPRRNRKRGNGCRTPCCFRRSIPMRPRSRKTMPLTPLGRMRPDGSRASFFLAKMARSLLVYQSGNRRTP